MAKRTNDGSAGAPTGGDPLASLHPASAAWFREAFPAGPTPAQALAWPRIAAGESVLLVSPTGTGKTLAAFLVALDGVLRRKLAGDDAPRLSTLYVSPLKALDNDVHRNLEAPRAGLRASLRRLGLPDVALEAAVRTGDTPQAQRNAQRRRPPDVLITTPESLYLLLTGGAAGFLAGVSTVILDEIHSVAGTKRGAHLALTLERLEGVIAWHGGRSPQRIALSATVRPVDAVAAFAGGVARSVTPLVVPAKKALDLTVFSPVPDFRELPAVVMGRADHPMRTSHGSAWEPVFERVAAEVEKRRTTLVFCNNRRLAERVAAKLEERLQRPVPTHHGSVARGRREEIERALKAGELPVLVATGSLELGIDVGRIDSVVLLESPKGVARGLQRVGRSGHLVGETARGLLLPLYQDDLFEAAATAEGMLAGDVEETRPPEFPLDVLAQQVVAEVVARAAAKETVTAAELLEAFRRAAPYERLPKSLFVETVAMLSGKYPKERFAELAPKLVWDRATDRLAPLPNARLAAILDGGTIGDRGVFKAVLRDRKTVVGDLDEEFIYETRAGDVFLLGSRSWRALEIAHDRVVVEDATGQPARMPFWRGEGLGRSHALGVRVGRLKRFIAERLDAPGLADLLRDRFAADENAAAAMAGAVRREVAESGGLASDESVVFESFPNDLGDPCVVVRSVFGRALNLPWSIVLSSVLREETGVDVETAVSDDGILLRMPRAERESPVERLATISAAEAKERLLAELPNSALFGARFRENAQRALLLPRMRTGKRTPFWLQRLKAKDLLQTTRALPDFPIVAETYRDCLRDLWEYDRLLALLDALRDGRVRRVVLERKTPSPAAASLLFRFIAVFMYEWDAPRAERDLHALAANRALLGEVLGDAADDGVRPEAVEAARADASRAAAHRMARNADELLSLLQELLDLTREEVLERAAGDGAAWLAALRARGSVVERALGGETRFIAAENDSLFVSLSSRARPGGAEAAEAEAAAALDRVLLAAVATRGPLSEAALARRYGLPPAAVAEGLERLRLEGLAVRGRFGTRDETLWAGARLAESIRRRTLAILRKEIRPVPAATFRAFVAKRQGAELGSRFAGRGAAERAVGLLRGLPLPLLSWETAILPARLAEPEPDALDVLSARGLLVWRASGVKELRAARLAFFFRGEGRFALPAAAPDLEALSPGARALHEALALSGASFLADLARSLGEGSGRLGESLLALVLAGLATGDGMHGLRSLLKDGRRERAAGAARGEAAPERRLGRHPGRAALREAESRVASRFSSLKPRAASGLGPEGRWSLLLSPGVLGEELSAVERAEAWARLLLARWGVVHRGVLDGEANGAVRWSDVAPVFARLELRGDVRRGEFVEGGGPLQYAEEETVELLRASVERRADEAAARPLAVAGGADPVLFGLEPRPAPTDWVALAGGEPLFVLGGDGALRFPSAEPTDRELKAAFAALQELVKRSRDPLDRPRRLAVATVSGRAAAGSPLAPLLESLGFSRDGDRYAWRAL